MKLRIVPSSLVCKACGKLAIGARCPDPDHCARNFVLGAWSSSMHHSRDAGMITAVDYAEIQRTQNAKICARPECKVLVAIDDDIGPNAFVGFIAGEPEERIVYYCFVKELSRRQGIARVLFAALDIDPCSRFAYPASTFILASPEGPRLSTKIPLARRDPAVARYPKQQRHRRYA